MHYLEKENMFISRMLEARGIKDNDVPYLCLTGLITMAVELDYENTSTKIVYYKEKAIGRIILSFFNRIGNDDSITKTIIGIDYEIIYPSIKEIITDNVNEIIKEIYKLDDNGIITRLDYNQITKMSDDDYIVLLQAKYDNDNMLELIVEINTKKPQDFKIKEIKEVINEHIIFRI